jgi:nitrate/nitrite transporter NarK
VIVSRWFMGKELAFALGINITVSRLGSVFNNIIEPPIVESMGLGTGMFFGFIICIISFCAGIGIIIMDRIAAKRDKLDTKIKPDEVEKVNLGDLKYLGACFWVITFNCFSTYLGIFPFNNISTSFMRSSFNFTQVQAGQVASLVFFIPAFIAPLFGFICDKFGYRVTFCAVSATLLAGAHLMFIVMG